MIFLIFSVSEVTLFVVLVQLCRQGRCSAPVLPLLTEGQSSNGHQICLLPDANLKPDASQAGALPLTYRGGTGSTAIYFHMRQKKYSRLMRKQWRTPNWHANINITPTYAGQKNWFRWSIRLYITDIVPFFPSLRSDEFERKCVPRHSPVIQALHYRRPYISYLW